MQPLVAACASADDEVVSSQVVCCVPGERVIAAAPHYKSKSAVTLLINLRTQIRRSFIYLRGQMDHATQ